MHDGDGAGDAGGATSVGAGGAPGTGLPAEAQPQTIAVTTNVLMAIAILLFIATGKLIVLAQPSSEKVHPRG
jgi:hypothetical protein